MTTTSPDLAALVTRYSQRFSVVPDTNSVSSGLGAWMLLSALTPLAEGATLAKLEDTLGCSADEAWAHLEALLKNPLPSVSSALAVWTDPQSVKGSVVEKWLERLGTFAQIGKIPTKAEADAWANKESLGLIPTFPVSIGATILFVATSVLATKIKWDAPFDAVPATSLTRASWNSLPAEVLQDKDNSSLYETTSAGVVGVHAKSGEGLQVYSVIAEPQVSPEDVMKAAYEIVQGGAKRLVLQDLDLGEGSFWKLSEQEEPVTPRGSLERSSALLPAWKAKSEWELLEYPLGFGEAIASLDKHIPEATGGRALQVAVAAYDREGFEAAALTVVMRMRSVPPRPTLQTVRHLDLEFNHAYASIATSSDSEGSSENSLWSGVPIFSAWVGVPGEVSAA